MVSDGYRRSTEKREDFSFCLTFEVDGLGDLDDHVAGDGLR